MLVFFIYGTEIGTGGDLTSQIEVPTFATGFDVCPRGYIFSLDGANGQIGRTGSCSLCAAKLYSVRYALWLWHCSLQSCYLLHSC
mmetsp:Transcript_36823/g.97836  ORF Transcript_36823/g.97836 Transcript_36823/m.97836 type:complete len:85 (+) Transcript_36823:1896-2150(+)